MRIVIVLFYNGTITNLLAWHRRTLFWQLRSLLV